MFKNYFKLIIFLAEVDSQRVDSRAVSFNNIGSCFVLNGVRPKEMNRATCVCRLKKMELASQQ